MKAVRGIVFILTALMMFAGADRGAAEPSKIRCAVGYSMKSMADVDPKDAAAALRVWAREMGDPYGFHVETFLYESADKLIRDFTEQKLDFVMLSTVDYLRAASTIFLPSRILYEAGFSTYTCFPAWQAQIVASACQ